MEGGDIGRLNCDGFEPFGSGGSGAKLSSLLPSSNFWFMVKSETENIMKVRLED
jgi:hypothetical protein